MKSITLHPVSILAGVVLAASVLLLTSAVQTSGAVARLPSADVRVVGEIPADWWTYVALSSQPDGTPVSTFTVPSDRHFVVTLIQGSTAVSANGQPVGGPLVAVGPTTATNKVRVVMPPGAFLTTGPGGSSQLWGYLEPTH